MLAVCVYIYPFIPLRPRVDVLCTLYDCGQCRLDEYELTKHAAAGRFYQPSIFKLPFYVQVPNCLCTRYFCRVCFRKYVISTVKFGYCWLSDFRVLFYNYLVPKSLLNSDNISCETIFVGTYINLVLLSRNNVMECCCY